MGSRIIETERLAPALAKELKTIGHNGIFVVTDSNVAKEVLPLLESMFEEYPAQIIIIEAGERNKNLDSLAKVWRELSDRGASRKSLVVNIGGGIVTDLGGFAASTFKRGMRFINIPTTILGAVDAAVGGKTGIDFNGVKNEVGAFALPVSVIISSEPLATLAEKEILSGFGEIVKTAMITSEDFYRLTLDENILSDKKRLQKTMTMSVMEKQRITGADPCDTGLRKILNFGHSAGHAFETFMLRRDTPVSHGAAIANGILVSLILSHMLFEMPSQEIYRYTDGILRPYFSPIPFGCKDYAELSEIMSHDKKNLSSSELRFVLLKAIGFPCHDIPVSFSDLHTSLDIYRDILHL